MNEQLAIGGFALAVFSFIFQVVVTIYYKNAHLQLARARLESELKEQEEDNG